MQLAGSVFVFIVGCIYSVFLSYAGSCLDLREQRSLIVSLACLSLLNFPFGSILGISTLLVLNRRSMRVMFENSRIRTKRWFSSDAGK